MITSYVAFPSLRNRQDNVNCIEALTIFLVVGLKVSFMVCWVGKEEANSLMLIGAVARIFLLPAMDCYKRNDFSKKKNLKNYDKFRITAKQEYIFTAEILKKTKY